MIENVEKINKPTHYICLDYIEVDDGPACICHIDVHKWTKTTKKEILEDIKKVAEEEPLPKYVIWDGEDETFLKFITMVGFVSTGCHTDNDGIIEYVYVWRE